MWCLSLFLIDILLQVGEFPSFLSLCSVLLGVGIEFYQVVFKGIYFGMIFEYFSEEI